MHLHAGAFSGKMTDNTDKKSELLEKINAFRSQLEELKNRASELDHQPHDDVFLDSLLENIPDSIYFKDTLSRFLLINKAHARLLGLQNPQDAYGKTDFDFLNPSFAQDSYADEQYIIKTGKPIINKREKITLPDSTYRWVSATKVPLRNNTGKIFGIVSISRDITDEKREEEKIGESEQRIRRLLTDSSDVISILDRKGTLLYESPSANRVFGVSSQKPRLGTNIFGFCHPEDLRRVIYMFSDLVQRPRESKKIIFRFRHADGSWLTLESICRNLLDDPAINGIIVSSRDITDRKRAEERIKIFEHVVKSANDCIIIADLNNYILFVNRSFCDTYLYHPEEVIGKHLKLLWSPRNADTKLEDIFPENEKKGWEGELISIRKDGTEFPIYLSTSVIKDESGNPIAVAGIVRDITKQKQLEDQLRQSQKMESLSVLVGGIAHNFNNILSVIMGYAALLEDPKLDREKLDRNVRTITEATERGAHLVHQLMTYIKKSPVRFENVSVNEVLEEMTEMAIQTFPKTLIFSLDIDPRNPVVHADRNQFRQVLFNLYLNARDAMPHGGTISIRTDIVSGESLRDTFVHVRDTEYVRISINDTGIGMDAEIQNRIFDPFFTTKEIGKGVGLGLPMVHGIVESHDGFIDVDSTLDKGSTFTVYFPLLRFEERRPEPVPVERKQTASIKDTILIVEDEESMRALLVDTLQDNNFTALQAEDGVQALELFEQYIDSIAAVILDIGLPRLGGYETFLQMHAMNPKIPVIIASGYNDPDAQLTLEAAGAKYFIQKPYKFSQILKTIRTVIDASAG
jgi:two-component system, cell cycle sensor histidine kinase and response regulator CckA